jgi:holliday junction DNA helicase RuvB
VGFDWISKSLAIGYFEGRNPIAVAGKFTRLARIGSDPGVIFRNLMLLSEAPARSNQGVETMSGNFYQQTTTTPVTAFDVSLRPPAFSEFIGQEKVKDRLLLMLEAAKRRGDVLDHVLLSGPPGLGKTTLANLISKAAGTQLHTTSGPQIEKAGDLAGVLTNIQKGDILFIDEIHRLHPAIEEYLYPAMEDFRLDIIIDSGPSARSIQINLPRFTLVGATTRSGMLTAPLRSRFGLVNRLDYYSIDELSQIIERSAGLLDVPVEPCGAREVALRARGTPRVANALLRWVRDYAQVRGKGFIDGEIADAALTMIEIDSQGLDEMDKRLLEVLIYKFNGGPVGLNSLAVACGEDAATIEEVHEPFLIMKGYLMRTPRGRTALRGAYDKIGATAPPSVPNEPQQELF